MTSDSLHLDYTVFSSQDSSTILNQESVSVKKSSLIVPVLFTLMTMTSVQPMKAGDISMVSQPITVCQTIDIVEETSKEVILKQFVSKLVTESSDIDPDIAEIVNRNFKKLLW